MKLSPINYLCALVGAAFWLALVFGTAFYFDDLILGELGERIAQNRGQSADLSTRAEDRKLLINYQSEAAEILSRCGYPAFSHKIEASKSIVSAITSLELSSAAGWHRDLVLLENSLSRQLPTLIGAAKGHGLLSRLERASQNSAEILSSMKVLEQQMAETRGSLTKTEARFTLLAADFVRLLGLEEFEIEKTSPTVSSPVYTGGVLKDYPRAPGLPDNIESLAVLREELRRLGGKTNFSSDEELAVFRTALEQTGVSSREILTEVREINAQFLVLSKKLKEKRQEISNSQRVIGSILTQLLTLISDPSLRQEKIAGAIKKVLAY